MYTRVALDNRRPFFLLAQQPLRLVLALCSCVIPELMGLLAAAAWHGSLLDGIGFALLLRLAWIAAELVHGAGHTLARAIVDRNQAAICLAHLLENRSAAQLARGLLPLTPIGPLAASSLPPAWLEVGDPEPWKLRLKAAGSIVLHFVVIVAAACWLAALVSSSSASAGSSFSALATLLINLIGTNLWLALASRTDWQTIVNGRASILYCGNFGVIASAEVAGRHELLSPQAIRLFHRMGQETEVRGAQAGGGLVMALDRRGDTCFVGHKIVNAKRGDLTPSLEAAFCKVRQRARRLGCRPHPAGLLACWHYRFGTSGPPAVRETHWHEWSPARQARLWRPVADGGWSCEARTVHHRITHNGDFEGFAAFGRLVDVTTELGPWLESALKQPAPAVVDSARIAGMMDLMICQGDWFAAVRWAFLHTMAPFPWAPPLNELNRWVSIFEQAFAERVRAHHDSGEDLAGLSQDLPELILPALCLDPGLKGQVEERLRLWIRRAIALFLHNDPAVAVHQFMQCTRGSFGLVVVSTTWPDRLVLCSLGQPITIGVDPKIGLALYASESAAVDDVLAGEQEAWRIDLDENAGEVAVLASRELQITSLSLERELTPLELWRRRHSYATPSPHGAPSISPRSSPRQLPPPFRQDPVAVDIAEIPSLLRQIHDDWSNPGSGNRQSADYLAQLLIAKAANLAQKQEVLRQAGLDDSLAKSRHVDLLLTGVENSLWLAEQFAEDLQALMPRLTVRTLSANAMLLALQNDIESLSLARQSIVLVLSHSSRTFPSRKVMEACDLMVRREVIREFFILTGEADSLLGSPMLGEAGPGGSGCERLFTTGAGRRRAEPATASVAAMHHTLTELLFSLTRQLLQAFPDDQQRPLGLVLTRSQLEKLKVRETRALLEESAQIVGVDGRGQRQPTATSDQLEQGGRHWAMHVLETPLAWGIHSLYILLSLELGMPLVRTLVWALVGEPLWSSQTVAGTLLRGVALAGDVGVYVFGPWLWTLALRWAQKRPLLARTGRRSVVIGEAPWIHPLLTNYISKLFALSFGITSVDVQGGEVGDHLLHTHAHRVVRGSLLFLGVPDGRGGDRKRALAEAALLAARQSDGIRHWDAGPEIVAVGSDPALVRGPFRRALLLPCATELGAGERTSGDGRWRVGEYAASDALLEDLRESRYGAFRRLLASYVYFWAMARRVGSLPLLRFKWWRSQSRTRVMTTAAPVSAAWLDLTEPDEILALSLQSHVGREQS